jgi:N-acetylneuraminic acid mutarotase
MTYNKRALLSLLLSAAFAQTAPAWADAAGHAHETAGQPGAAQWKPIAAQGDLEARHESSAALLGNRMYVLGGRGERAMQYLDLGTSTWHPAASPPLEVHHAQAVAHAGKLYIISGFTGGFPDEQALTHALVYDPAPDTWSQGTEIPAERRRGAAGVAVIDGVAYVVGGNTQGHNAGYVAWLDALDLADGTWTRLADAPHARDHFHAAVVGGRIYVAGGRQSSHNTGEAFSKTVSPVDIYDPSQRRWINSDIHLPTARAGSTSVEWNGKLVVLGGESASQTAAHAEVEALDATSRTWSTLPPLPRGRHGTQAVTRDGKLYVAAGSGNRGGGPELSDVVVLDIE